MAIATKTTLLVSFLLLILCSVGGITDGADPEYSLHKGGFRIQSRKLSGPDAVLDYDDAGANPRHDPRKGKPGGGRNP